MMYFGPVAFIYNKSILLYCIIIMPPFNEVGVYCFANFVSRSIGR